VVGAVAAQHHRAQGRLDPVEVEPAAVPGGELVGDEAVLDEQAAAKHGEAAPALQSRQYVVLHRDPPELDPADVFEVGAAAVDLARGAVAA
jgi:hypothetical protein